MYVVSAQIGKYTLPHSVLQNHPILLGISELGSLKVVSGILVLVGVAPHSNYV